MKYKFSKYKFKATKKIKGIGFSNPAFFQMILSGKVIANEQ
jgi:hypothetical protein